jgi:hypothetical protein
MTLRTTAFDAHARSFPQKRALVQRTAVWDESRMAMLLDSILVGYPVGTLLLYKTRNHLQPTAISGARCSSPLHGLHSGVSELYSNLYSWIDDPWSLYLRIAIVCSGRDPRLSHVPPPRRVPGAGGSGGGPAHVAASNHEISDEIRVS